MIEDRMTDYRIRIADLRMDAAHVIDSGGMDHGKTLVDPDELLALLGAVEAAHAYREFLDERTAGTMLPDLGRLTARIDTALDRFDFSEPA